MSRTLRPQDPALSVRDAEPSPGPQSFYRSAVRRLSRTVPVARVPFLRGQAVALICLLAATLARLALDPVLTGVPYVTFFPAVLIASIWGGTRAGLTTLMLSWTISAFFWLDPPGRPSFDGGALWKALAFAVFGGVLLICAGMLRDLVTRLRASEERAILLANEMEHRIENLLTTAIAIARQTARSADSVEAHVRYFEARLRALGDARKLVGAAPHGEADLGRLMAGVLAPFERERFDLSGPPAAVPEALATMLALAVHELATNALKYGALSRPGGRVRIGWTRAGGLVRLEWRESGGPQVAAPARTGFGTRMIRHALASHGAETEIDFAPEGLRCRIVYPDTSRPGLDRSATTASSPLPANGAAR